MMTSDEFCQRLGLLGFNQSSFARRLMELGDTRSFTTILRTVNNLARGVSGVSGEMEVILHLMTRFPEVRGPIQEAKPGRPRKARPPGA